MKGKVECHKRKGRPLFYCSRQLQTGQVLYKNHNCTTSYAHNQQVMFTILPITKSDLKEVLCKIGFRV